SQSKGSRTAKSPFFSAASALKRAHISACSVDFRRLLPFEVSPRLRTRFDLFFVASLDGSRAVLLRVFIGLAKRQKSDRKKALFRELSNLYFVRRFDSSAVFSWLKVYNYNAPA